MNLLLIGYRGSGKTAVGRIVAQRLGWDAIDADEVLEGRARKSIAQIFADDGEPAFRDLESQVLSDLIARERQVLSLGGGVVLRLRTDSSSRSQAPSFGWPHRLKPASLALPPIRRPPLVGQI